MQRVLFIGGTGMLQKACSHLIENKFKLTIVGRNENRLQYFKDNYPLAEIQLYKVDYTNENSFLTIIQKDVIENGNYSTVVCWMHSSGTTALEKLITLLNKSSTAVKFYHILGSYDSRKPADNSILKHIDTKRIDYRKIVLGFVHENGRSRWLSHQEISEGTTAAIESNSKAFVIGQVEPWHLRP